MINGRFTYAFGHERGLDLLNLDNPINPPGIKEMATKTKPKRKNSRSEIKELRDLLKECEWRCGHNVPRCPICGGEQVNGHRDGCRLAEKIIG